jgi:cystathionine beta-lyase/cystathionine gamma-synthase
VERVHYPFLPSSPSYPRAHRLLAGGGGVLSFELKGSVADADGLLSRLELPIRAPSLGGVETLITRPATTSHLGLDPAERRRMGISDTLIRVAVGIEATEDLIEDFDRALRG